MLSWRAHPNLEIFCKLQKDALIVALWVEGAAPARPPHCLGEHPSRAWSNTPGILAFPPFSKTPKANTPARPPRGRREASVGRAGGGRPLHPEPDQIIVAKAKSCPHCGHGVQDIAQQLHSVYDKIELPPVKPFVTGVEQYGGQCAHCGQAYVAPVPVGTEPGTPFGPSIQSLATYLRYTHAISYERLAGLLAQVFGLSISEGALANLFQGVKARLDHRVAEILTRLRRSRLLCSDETSARVNGKNQWERAFQNDEVCIHVIRPSRGHGVIQEVLGDHRPRVWVSDLDKAQKHHPAEQWQVCLAHQLRDCQFALEVGDNGVRPTDEGSVSARLCHPQTPRPVGRVHALAVSRGHPTPAGRVLGPDAGLIFPLLQ